MNADTFKRNVQQLRDEHKRKRERDTQVQVERDQDTLKKIYEAMAIATKNDKASIDLSRDFVRLSEGVVETLRNSGCNVYAQWEESQLTNTQVVKGYTITWLV
jgi:hypothetical protein